MIRKILVVFFVMMTMGLISEELKVKYVKDVTHGAVLSMPKDPFGYFAWPSIVRQKDGTLCVVASGFRKSHVCPWGRTVITKSKDDGKTWSFPKIINNSPIDDRDAGLVDLGNGRLAVTWFTSNTGQILKGQRKPDGSWPGWLKSYAAVFETWTPEMIERELGSWTRVSEDGEYWGEVRRAPVTSPHGFIVLKDGSWLYLGKQWENTGKGTALTGRADTEICAARSTDEGRTWEMLGSVPRPEYIKANTCHEPHVLELADGALLGVIRVEGAYQVINGANASVLNKAPRNEYDFRTMVTRSNDGGRTWSEMEEIGAKGAPPHLLRHSSGAIVCVFGYRRRPFGQHCMISYDNGKTWSEEYVLRDDSATRDLGYPASVELKDGSIFTIYYQHEGTSVRSSILWTRWKLPERE